MNSSCAASAPACRAHGARHARGGRELPGSAMAGPRQRARQCQGWVENCQSLTFVHCGASFDMLMTWSGCRLIREPSRGGRSRGHLLGAELGQDGGALRPGGVARGARAQVERLQRDAGRRVERRQQDLAQLLGPAAGAPQGRPPRRSTGAARLPRGRATRAGHAQGHACLQRPTRPHCGSARAKPSTVRGSPLHVQARALLSGGWGGGGRGRGRTG